VEYTLDELTEIIEKLPESFRQEFYYILADKKFTDTEKKILILDRLNKIFPLNNPYE